MPQPSSPCILYVGSFPPRECGIATFTQDLTNAMDKEFNPGVKSRVLAINDNGTSIYNYPRRVKWQINETDLEDYLKKAKEINQASEVKLVNIQHEYGIFGGDNGNYILPFLEILRKPTVVTMHTVLPNPNSTLRKVTFDMADKSLGLVVMTNNAARLLQNKYSINKNKVFVVPHGVHHVPFPSKSRAKQKLNLTGHTILSTFGMLNSDKGIEYAIEALPEIVEKFPKVMYLVIGATHPMVRREEGERYRNKLKRTVEKLKLKNYVKFYNKYLSLPELIEYLKATDIYISPTLNPRQAVSGTISYALSCACPIISTANQYAKDSINKERGMLTRFRNSDDIKKALQDMLADKNMAKELGRNAYFYSRHMTWQNVALSYFSIFNNFAKVIPREEGKLPSINLGHVRTLTDSFGIIQFASHTKPDIHSGYCVDDNTRALLACTSHYDLNPTKSVESLIQIYFNFLKFAQKPNGKFYNFVSYQKTFHDKSESEDSFGRAIWALGYILGSDNSPEEFQKKSKTIFNKAIKNALELKSLRAISFTIIGLCHIARKKENNIFDEKKIEEIQNLVKRLTDKIVRRYNKTIGVPENKWFWFEDQLTYSNYKIPEALLSAYKVIENKKYLEIAEKSLEFLSTITFPEDKDYFCPIGQDGWYFRDGKRAFFDQQPEDASSAVEALVAAHQITKNKIYHKQAHIAFEWFLGKNHLNQMVYDEATGGCYDGLGRRSINFNQGAESTLSYLLARLAMENIK